ncbi:hypothetical protein SAMN02910447_03030 [Ruminococcus sp. YE71]|uniref:hypothetical protein n=1 Tax=unclassified Ruminococcus TaxID=2608920 RepID=UPI00087F87C3|nr:MULTISPECIES: hypothetical protein [unclassified Ruminococcus]SDA29354.1 hypothetical protein SAMN02910446_03101 [Ruminococcus sp. YE78]SFW48098.1 hypothetical protein SAMN02910447_03030 [Ruminococcus sp. YE71]
MEKFKEILSNIKEKLLIMDRYDYFPLNKKLPTYEMINCAKLIGIYIGALIVFIAIFVLLGMGLPAWISWLFKVIGVVGGVYSLLGFCAVLYDITQNYQ